MATNTTARRFCLNRKEDETGVSGTGIVCHGVQLPSGKCVLEWDTNTTSIGIYDSIDRVEEVHGHAGKTVVEWVDPDPAKMVKMRLKEKS